MDPWTLFFVVTTFSLYIGIAIWARAGSTDDFYVAGHDVHPTVNGMATAADWMSATAITRRLPASSPSSARCLSPSPISPDR